MDEQLHKENLGKIRYQLGKVIKSWSKVDRIIEEKYTAYAVDDTTFVFLHDDLILIPIDYLREDTISIKYEKKKLDDYEPIPLLSNTTVYQFSIEDIDFTRLLPSIERSYRRVVLSKY